MNVRFYCPECGAFQPVQIESMQADERNPRPWGDIVCEVCRMVIATVTADELGTYRFVRVDRETDST